MIELLKTSQPAARPVREGAHHHAHQHEHGHRDPAHHDHGRGGNQDVPVTRIGSPRFSLLALSSLQRLMLVAAPIAALWLLAFWAVRHG